MRQAQVSVPVSTSCVIAKPAKQPKQNATVRNLALEGAAVSFSHMTLEANHARSETQVLEAVFYVSFVV